MQTQTSEEIKKLIMAELPRLMERDPAIRKYILKMTREQYADKIETENRIERILDELKRDREDQQKRWDDQQKRWDENQRVIMEILVSIKRVDRRIDSTIGALGARWGLSSEAAFRNGLRAILQESFGVKVERYEDYDHDGLVFGRPDQVELDVIIHNGTVILCEIKSSVSKPDMYIFWRKKEFYENKHDVKVARVMVISPMIDDRAGVVAKDLGIETYGYAEDVTI
jgi:hypothetical protein